VRHVDPDGLVTTQLSDGSIVRETPEGDLVDVRRPVRRAAPLHTFAGIVADLRAASTPEDLGARLRRLAATPRSRASGRR
jgi:hypothetical protein